MLAVTDYFEAREHAFLQRDDWCNESEAGDVVEDGFAIAGDGEESRKTSEVGVEPRGLLSMAPKSVRVAEIAEQEFAVVDDAPNQLQRTPAARIFLRTLMLMMIYIMAEVRVSCSEAAHEKLP
jgi:hypothetical protein